MSIGMSLGVSLTALAALSFVQTSITGLAVVTRDGAHDVSWGAFPDADNYLVESRSGPNSDLSAATFAEVGTPSSNSLTAAGTDNDQFYEYRVTARNASNEAISTPVTVAVEFAYTSDLDEVSGEIDLVLGNEFSGPVSVTFSGSQYPAWNVEHTFTPPRTGDAPVVLVAPEIALSGTAINEVRPPLYVVAEGDTETVTHAWTLDGATIGGETGPGIADTTGADGDYVRTTTIAVGAQSTAAVSNTLSVGQAAVLPVVPLARYDLTRLDTMWTDATLTTRPTQVGDSVYRVDDLSGNGHHIIQANASLRPTVSLSGGLDFFSEQALRMEIAFPADTGIVWAASLQKSSNNGVLLPTENNNVYTGVMQSGDTTSVVSRGVVAPLPLIRVDGAPVSPLNRDTLNTAVVGASPKVVLASGINNPSMFVQVGAYTTSGFSFDGRFNEIVICDALNPTELSDLETYLARHP